jgi:hypothetical protein
MKLVEHEPSDTPAPYYGKEDQMRGRKSNRKRSHRVGRRKSRRKGRR